MARSSRRWTRRACGVAIARTGPHSLDGCSRRPGCRPEPRRSPRADGQGLRSKTMCRACFVFRPGRDSCDRDARDRGAGSAGACWRSRARPRWPSYWLARRCSPWPRTTCPSYTIGYVRTVLRPVRAALRPDTEPEVHLSLRVHLEALSVVHYGIVGRKGITLVVGEAGRARHDDPRGLEPSPATARCVYLSNPI